MEEEEEEGVGVGADDGWFADWCTGETGEEMEGEVGFGLEGEI